MKHAVLLVEPMLAEIEARLDEAYEVHRLFRDEDQAGLAAVEGSIRAVVTGGGTGLSDAWFARLPALGIVAVNGVGTDRVDLDYADAHDIHVSTTPGVLTDAVADIGMALILGVYRRVAEGDRFVREGRWAAGDKLALGTSPGGKRLGVLGFGEIGRALAERARAFKMEVGYWNRSPVAAEGYERFDTPVDLARASDVLVVAIAANAATENFVGADILAALGPDGVLINVARGSVVDEDALIAALQSGGIAGAGLDVFVGEPRIRPEFLQLSNALLIPHQGSATIETRRAMGEIVLANLAAYFAGETPPTSVIAARRAARSGASA